MLCDVLSIAFVRLTEDRSNSMFLAILSFCYVCVQLVARGSRTLSRAHVWFKMATFVMTYNVSNLALQLMMCRPLDWLDCERLRPPSAPQPASLVALDTALLDASAHPTSGQGLWRALRLLLPAWRVVRSSPGRVLE